MLKQLTAVIEREGDGFVALCPELRRDRDSELDIASQGNTIEESRQNIREAIELFFETSSPAEVKQRFHDEIYITQVEVSLG
mgnify:CR=1 FL=1